MKKSFNNESIKREYFSFLKDAKGYSKKTIDASERSILLWQECTDNKDFSRFGKQQVYNFKDWIKTRTSKSNKLLSLGYIYNVFHRLKKFFEWLSMQPNYRSKINQTVIEYLSLSNTEKCIAVQPSKRDTPPIKDVIKVIENIEINNDVDKRDRALICLALLTGGRISAIISLPLKAFDEKSLTIEQSPKIGVKTKYSKRIVTRFFPLEYSKAKEYFLDWYRHLKEVKGFTPTDPIFPMAIIENGQQNICYQNTGEVEPTFWQSANPARRIFKKRFEDAGVRYYNPHSFRHLVVELLSKTRLTEEEKRAISQNLGHKNVGTTFGSYGYGQIGERKQIDIVKNIKLGKNEKEGKSSPSLEEIERAIEKAFKKNKS